MLKLTDVKIAYIYNKLSYLYASRVGIVMPINNFIMLLPGCLYYSNPTYMSIRNGHKFQTDIQQIPYGADLFPYIKRKLQEKGYLQNIDINSVSKSDYSSE